MACPPCLFLSPRYLDHLIFPGLFRDGGRGAHDRRQAGFGVPACALAYTSDKGDERGAVPARGSEIHSRPQQVSPPLRREFAAAFADARLYIAPGLQEKRKDLRFHGTLSDEPEPYWEDSLKQHVFQGIPAVNEVVFFHPESRTVIFTDLVFNFFFGPLAGPEALRS